MSHSSFDGAQARAMRVAAGLSQRQVSRQTGINRTYLSLFEGGKYNLDGEQRGALREFLETREPLAGVAQDSGETAQSDRPNSSPTKFAEHDSMRHAELVNYWRNMSRVVFFGGSTKKTATERLAACFASWLTSIWTVSADPVCI